MTVRTALIALALAAPALATPAFLAPALATPCADEVSTLQRRLDSAGAASVTGRTPPGGPTTPGSDKALASPPPLTKGDASVKPTASGVDEAKALVAEARKKDEAGDAQGCRDTILKAKEKAGALP